MDTPTKKTTSTRDWFSDFKSSGWGSSSYWLGGNSYWDTSSRKTGSSTTDVIKMASAKRSISNFVTIVTKKRVPVEFVREGANSKTDGKTVLISSDVNKPEDFDIAVGLALHEGSHIKLSDYKILEQLSGRISAKFGRRIGYYTTKANNSGTDLIKLTKNMLNWVEDRRIDQYIYTEAPGYQGYYHAMYRKYFNSDYIRTALQSASFRDETVQSYLIRVINLHSEYTDLTALKGLNQISKIVDLQNISRLQDTDAAFEVATEIVKVILDNVHSYITQRNNNENPKPKKSDESEPAESEPGNETETGAVDEEAADEDTGSGAAEDETEEESKSTGSDSEDTEDEAADEDTSSGSDSEDTEDEAADEDTSSGSEAGAVDAEVEAADAEPDEIGQTDFKNALAALEKQIQFVNGDVDKAKISDEVDEQLRNIIESRIDLTNVGQDFGRGEIQCIVARNLTESLLNEKSFPMRTNHRYYDDEVTAGIQMGTLLGKKLLIRSESRETVFNRQSTGKIDKRMVSSLGYGYESVFFTKEIDTYKKANLHISVDASGSMIGDKWRKTIQTVVALAKAVDMISNLEIQISFRTVNDSELPYIVIAYDSRVDKFSKVRKLFPKIAPSNTTPEGLAFEAIEKLLVPSDATVDSYFLNFSDGEPYYNCPKGGKIYSGKPAAAHTNRIMKLIEAKGIKVLSYFISEAAPEQFAVNIFKSCYGKAASFINVNSIQEVTRTMNALFLNK